MFSMLALFFATASLLASADYRRPLCPPMLSCGGSSQSCDQLCQPFGGRLSMSFKPTCRGSAASYDCVCKNNVGCQTHFAHSGHQAQGTGANSCATSPQSQLECSTMCNKATDHPGGALFQLQINGNQRIATCSCSACHILDTRIVINEPTPAPPSPTPRPTPYPTIYPTPKVAHSEPYFSVLELTLLIALCTCTCLAIALCYWFYYMHMRHTRTVETLGEVYVIQNE